VPWTAAGSPWGGEHERAPKWVVEARGLEPLTARAQCASALPAELSSHGSVYLVYTRILGLPRVPGMNAVLFLYEFHRICRENPLATAIPSLSPIPADLWVSGLALGGPAQKA